jgi:hypothetical protein
MVDEGLDRNAGSFEARLTAHPVRIDPDDLVKLGFLLLSHVSRVPEIGQGRKEKAIVGSGAVCSARVPHDTVIPAKAGIHSADHRKWAFRGLDSRFRGNDHPAGGKWQEK